MENVLNTNAKNACKIVRSKNGLKRLQKELD